MRSRIHNAGRLLVLLLIALAELACRKTTAAPPPRYAIVRFENLSGDPSLEWIARAAGETLSVSLAGALDGAVLPSSALSRMTPLLGPRPSSAPGSSTQRQEAMLAGANRLISGYIERQGGLVSITAVEETLPGGRTLRIAGASAPSPIAALDRLVRDLSPHAAPLPTSNETALRLYSTALESPLSNTAADLEGATRADPDFGAAWVALSNLDVARGDRAAAEDAIARAGARKLDPLSRARLNLESANLGSDTAARIEALRKVAALSPGDSVLQRTLAETEMSTGAFAAAAADWKKQTAALPDDFSAWNSLGYALADAGKYDDALAAFREYARIRPKDANTLDSIGDLNYFFRKFPQAADSYLKAHDLQPDFAGYGDLYKAAWAKFNAGDKTAADALFSQFREAREKAGEKLMALISADWLYRTGRMREAIESLRKAVAGPESETVRADGYAQLVIWDLLAHDRAQASRDAQAIDARGVNAPVFIARFAALPSASAAEWESRADGMIPPAMAALRPLALGYALLLDGKREAAVPVWANIVKGSSATDFFARAIYTRLQGKPLERPLVPDPSNYNHFLAVLDAL